MYGIVCLILLIASFWVHDKSMMISMMGVASLFAIADAILSLRNKNKKTTDSE